ncbi:MAG: helical backbone metal receptor [Candidatus Sumerlaeaceae bacterium]|nr:helical backbone metal receptor [Candidatus Sumerlaeaceae bacterium]
MRFLRNSLFPWQLSGVIVLVLWFAGECRSETTRVVSLLPSFTEIAFEMGAEPLIVGVSDYCRFPAEAQKKPRVGGLLNPSLEAIVALKPTVVVLSTANAELGEKLRKLHLDVQLYPTDSLEDVFALLRTSGALLGQTERAEQFEREWQNCLRRLQTLAGSKRHPRTLIVVSRQPGSLKDMYAATESSYLGQLAKYAGAANIVRRAHRAYVTISPEEILAENPEIILDFSFGELARGATTQHQHLAAWDQLETIVAVRLRRIHAMSDPHLTIPGPFMCATAQLMANLLHKDCETTMALRH